MKPSINTKNGSDPGSLLAIFAACWCCASVSLATTLDFQGNNALLSNSPGNYGSNTAPGVLNFNTPNVTTYWRETTGAENSSGPTTAPWKDFGINGSFYGHDNSALGLSGGGITKTPRIMFFADPSHQLLLESIEAYSYEHNQIPSLPNGNLNGSHTLRATVDGAIHDVVVPYTGDASEPVLVDFTALPGYGPGSFVTLQAHSFTGPDPQAGAWAWDKLTFSQVAGGFDPATYIHINSVGDVATARSQLIDKVWPGTGVPTAAMPDAVITEPGIPTDLSGLGLNPTNVASIERIESTAGFLPNRQYLISPTAINNKNDVLVILHQGHGLGASGYFYGNFPNVANQLLAEGYHVNVMAMPVVGWHSDYGSTYLTSATTGETYGNQTHDHLIAGFQEAGLPELAPFAEPVTIAINYFVSQNPDYDYVAMTGLSGGGWTTEFVAALDERIRLSFPVAGSRPIPLPGGAGIGEGEAQLPGIVPDTNYLDLYALGGLGTDRKQIKINNQFDNCCFNGTVDVDNYTPFLEAHVASLGGDWTFVLDDSVAGHVISQDTLTNVILPALEAALAPPTSSFWEAVTGGFWTDSANWDSLGGVPNSADRTAVFGNSIQADATVAFDSPLTINRVEFDNQSNSYAIAGFSTLNLAPTTDAIPINPSVDVNGNHAFQVAVDLLADTTVDISSGSSLEFFNRLSLNGHTLTKTGTGTLLVDGNLEAGGGSIVGAAGVIAGHGTLGASLHNTGAVISPGADSTATSQVPEPGTAMLLGIGGLLLLNAAAKATRRRHKDGFPSGSTVLISNRPQGFV